VGEGRVQLGALEQADLAALAHEINNPLGALCNSLCLLKSDLRLTGDNARLLEVAVEEASHLSQIVNDFLSYARFRHARLERNDLNEQVSNALFLMMRDERMKSGVEVVTELARDLPPAQIDRNQLHEVVFNLVTNALDALGGSGTLTIRTYNARLESAPAVGLLVEDSGAGIPAENKDKIFAPFFTTKQGGTGLGLSIVKRIVEDHHGVISVESEQNHGTKVSVAIPISREEAPWHRY